MTPPSQMSTEDPKFAKGVASLETSFTFDSELRELLANRDAEIAVLHDELSALKEQVPALVAINARCMSRGAGGDPGAQAGRVLRAEPGVIREQMGETTRHTAAVRAR